MDWDQIATTAVALVGGGSIGAFAMKLLDYWLKQHKMNLDATVAEEKAEIEGQKAGIEKDSATVESIRIAMAELRKDKDAALQILSDRVKVLEADGRDSRRAEAKCREDLATLRGDYEVKVALLKGELRLIQNTLQRLQQEAGYETPGQLAVTVVINVQGKILDVSPTVSAMLQWIPVDLIGRNITVLMPERYREAHERGLKKIKDHAQPPWPDRIIEAEALRKDGVEIPIATTLKAWQDEGNWYVTGVIRQRPSLKLADSGRFKKIVPDEKKAGGQEG